uniref:Sushi domain-containing protein n=1 Tax=Chromera velia CCMP2878 TaxID=1169474 RepID=A0A0G4F0C8_9ALVE|eukprot:Cvel_2567.t1-p1 / transcript=Cvel_2567.t1 / gene=Cvel_2567 / organism=Chromera_velia_CCMP2878 / gene_product=hypothetical protein / transcript_product=hypothetical protein / location=Cvel_scaffold101:112029-120919(+) / protein_length=1869 / sequence_SO=supercontig / SO=protein_coding / is_pseudo=false
MRVSLLAEAFLALGVFLCPPVAGLLSDQRRGDGDGEVTDTSAPRGRHLQTDVCEVPVDLSGVNSSNLHPLLSLSSDKPLTMGIGAQGVRMQCREGTACAYWSTFTKDWIRALSWECETQMQCEGGQARILSSARNLTCSETCEVPVDLSGVNSSKLHPLLSLGSEEPVAVGIGAQWVWMQCPHENACAVWFPDIENWFPRSRYDCGTQLQCEGGQISVPSYAAKLTCSETCEVPIDLSGVNSSNLHPLLSLRSNEPLAVGIGVQRIGVQCPADYACAVWSESWRRVSTWDCATWLQCEGGKLMSPSFTRNLTCVQDTTCEVPADLFGLNSSKVGPLLRTRAGAVSEVRFQDHEVELACPEGHECAYWSNSEEWRYAGDWMCRTSIQCLNGDLQVTSSRNLTCLPATCEVPADLSGLNISNLDPLLTRRSNSISAVGIVARDLDLQCPLGYGCSYWSTEGGEWRSAGAGPGRRCRIPVQCNEGQVVVASYAWNLTCTEYPAIMEVNSHLSNEWFYGSVSGTYVLSLDRSTDGVPVWERQENGWQPLLFFRCSASDVSHWGFSRGVENCDNGLYTRWSGATSPLEISEDWRHLVVIRRNGWRRTYGWATDSTGSGVSFTRAVPPQNNVIQGALNLTDVIFSQRTPMVTTVSANFKGTTRTSWSPCGRGWRRGRDLWYTVRVPFGVAVYVKTGWYVAVSVLSGSLCAEESPTCKCAPNYWRGANFVFDDSDESDRNPDNSIDVFVRIQQGWGERDGDFTFEIGLKGCPTDVSTPAFQSFCPDCHPSLTVRNETPDFVPPSDGSWRVKTHTVGYQCPERHYCGRRYQDALHTLPRFARVEPSACEIHSVCSFDGNLARPEYSSWDAFGRGGNVTQDALGCFPEVEAVSGPGDATETETASEQMQNSGTSFVEVLTFVGVPVLLSVLFVALFCFRIPVSKAKTKTTPMPDDTLQLPADENRDALSPPPAAPALVAPEAQVEAAPDVAEDGAAEEENRECKAQEGAFEPSAVPLSIVGKEDNPPSQSLLLDSSPLISEIAHFFLKESGEVTRETAEQNESAGEDSQEEEPTGQPLPEMAQERVQEENRTEETEDENRAEERQEAENRGEKKDEAPESVGLLAERASRRSFFFLRLKLSTSPDSPTTPSSTEIVRPPATPAVTPEVPASKSRRYSVKAKTGRGLILHLDEMPITTLMSSFLCYAIGAALLFFFGVFPVNINVAVGGTPLLTPPLLILSGITVVLVVCQCVSLLFPPRSRVASIAAWLGLLLAAGCFAVSAFLWKGNFSRGPEEALIGFLVSAAAYAFLCYPAFVRRQLPRGFSHREAQTLLRLHRKSSSWKGGKGEEEHLREKSQSVEKKGDVELSERGIVRQSEERAKSSREAGEESGGVAGEGKEVCATSVDKSGGSKTENTTQTQTSSAVMLSTQTFGFSSLAFHPSDHSELHALWKHPKKQRGDQESCNKTASGCGWRRWFNRRCANAVGGAIALMVRCFCTSLSCCRLTFAASSRLESARLFLTTMVGLSFLALSSTVSVGAGLMWWSVPSTTVKYPSADVWAWGTCNTVLNDGGDPFECAIPGMTSSPVFVNGSTLLGKLGLTWASRVDFGGFVLLDMPAVIREPQEGWTRGMVRPDVEGTDASEPPEEVKRHLLLLPAEVENREPSRTCDELTVEYFDSDTFLELNKEMFDRGCGRGDLFSRHDFVPSSWCVNEGEEALSDFAWRGRDAPSLLVCPMSTRTPVYWWIVLGLSPVILFNVVFMERSLLTPQWPNASLLWSCAVLLCVFSEVAMALFGLRGYLKQREDALSFSVGGGRDGSNAPALVGMSVGSQCVLILWKVVRLWASGSFLKLWKACRSGSSRCQRGQERAQEGVVCETA